MIDRLCDVPYPISELQGKNMRHEDSQRLSELLATYAETHQNPLNVRIHFVCVPAILISILWLLLAIPAPKTFGMLNWAYVAGLVLYFHYRRMSRLVALGFLCMFGFAWLSNLAWVRFFPGTENYAAIAIFVLAWIAQFYGHHVEGKRPAFLMDLQFLLIGPAWILVKIFKRLNWRY